METSPRVCSWSWLTLGYLETLGWSLGGSPVPFKSCARLCFILLPSYRKQMGTGIWGTARISGSSTFVCVLRTAIQVLERDQTHRINQNISIILAKSQLKEFRAVMSTVSGCVGTGEPVVETGCSSRRWRGSQGALPGGRHVPWRMPVLTATALGQRQRCSRVCSHFSPAASASPGPAGAGSSPRPECMGSTCVRLMARPGCKPCPGERRW